MEYNKFFKCRDKFILSNLEADQAPFYFFIF